MDFAATAVIEAAPRPRADARPARGDDGAFRDHLDIAMEAPGEDAPTPEASSEKPFTAAKTPATGESGEAPELTLSAEQTQSAPDAALLGAPQPQPAPPPQAPVAVQLMIAQAAPETPPPANAATQAPSLPQAAPVDPAQAAPRPIAATPPSAPGLQAPAQTRDTVKDANPAKETPAPAQPQTLQGAPSALAPPSAGPSVTIAAAAPAPAPTLTQAAPESAAIAAQAVAPAPSDPRAAQALRNAKAAQQTQGAAAKSFADEASAPRTPIVKGGPKIAAPPAGNAKEASAPIAQLGDGAPQISAQPVAATAQHAAQTQSVALDHSVTRAAPAATQVAREIVRRFDGESTRFELRLDPPELGRIEVRLEVSRDNRVTAVIAADNPQALTELARHSRELEQQLQSAGLELGDNGLSFDLRQGAQSDGDARSASDIAPGGASGEAAAQDAAPAARAAVLERWRGVRVDVMA